MQRIDQALAHILDNIQSISDCEKIHLSAALHRTLSSPAVSIVDVPPANVSAMDGYAINCQDLSLAMDAGLAIGLRIPAGSSPSSLPPESAARIFTGAVVPENANAVVIQENCQLKDNTVKILQAVSQGENIRQRGQDSSANTTIFEAGQLLRAQDIGLLASVGLAEVTVKRQLKVAILSSGDELVEPGHSLSPGKIYNSNRYLLKSLLSNLNIEVVDIGMVKDNLQTTIDALQTASEKADCVISTGGVSVGEEDHLKSAVEAIGTLNLWKLAIKPGKPLAFGTINDHPFFGLPGNPVAVFVTFLMIVRPALFKLQGTIQPSNEFIQKFPANFSTLRSSPRQEYLRVRIENGKIETFRTQDSSVLTSTSWANALAIVPTDTTVELGDLLEVLPFSGFNL